MLEQLQRLFSREPEPVPEVSSHDRHQLAAAALLVTAGAMDAEFDEVERERVLELLQSRFGLAADEARELLEEAEVMAQESVDLYGFTSVIKEGFAPEERIDIVEMVWEVVYTDGMLHDHEASLMRRLVGLLGVSDRDSGDARIRVRRRLGL